MINNPDCQKPKIKQYLHQLSPECIEKIAVFMEGININEMDCDTCLIIQGILCNEIEDDELLGFAIESTHKLSTHKKCVLFIVHQ